MSHPTRTSPLSSTQRRKLGVRAALQHAIALGGFSQTLSVLMDEVEHQANEHAGTEYGYGLRDLLSALDSATVRAACAEPEHPAAPQRR
jgi:hypothetical protein